MKMKQKEKYYILNIFKLHSNKFVRCLSGQTAPSLVLSKVCLLPYGHVWNYFFNLKNFLKHLKIKTLNIMMYERCDN